MSAVAIGFVLIVIGIVCSVVHYYIEYDTPRWLEATTLILACLLIGVGITLVVGRWLLSFLGVVSYGYIEAVKTADEKTLLGILLAIGILNLLKPTKAKCKCTCKKDGV